MALANKKKRVEEIELILDQFKVSTEARSETEIFYKEGSSKKIVDTYEILLFEYVKHFIKSRAEIYKVASGLEVATLYVQPILHNDPSTGKLLNAALSASVATHFVFQCIYDDIKFNSSDDGLNKRVEVIYTRHLEWLLYSTMTELYDFAIFSNANFWETFATLYDTQHRL